MSPFRERTREYYLNVGEGKCAYEYYDEKRGWQICNKPAKHIHHIEPESVALERGGDPEKNTGIPLCENHHVRNLSGEIYSAEASFHPDIARAYRMYPEYKRQVNHLGLVRGKKITTKEIPSPFQEVAQEHRQKARRGERFHSGTEETDDYFEEQMKQKEWEYYLKTGEKRPDMKQHPEFKPKKSLWEKIFG